MKCLVANALLCLLGSPLIAGCASAGSRPPAESAVLIENTDACRAQLTDAVRGLTGKAVTLAADSFMRNDSVVLSTFGQTAGGRMMPPTEILRLELVSQVCQLRLEGRDRTVALPRCSCRTAAGK